MKYKVTIDFLGMAVVVRVKATSRLFVGLLNEPGHIHTINYFGSQQQPAISSLDLRCAGHHTLSVDAGQQVVDTSRLFDISAFTPLPLDDLLKQFSTVFELPGGELKSFEAHVGDRVSRWTVPGGAPFLLTDRMRFEGSTSMPQLRLGDLVLNNRGDEIYAAVSSIDRDYGMRIDEIKAGFPLTEFAMFYRLTQSYGPVPSAEPLGRAANPDSSVCPLGYVEV